MQVKATLSACGGVQIVSARAASQLPNAAVGGTTSDLRPTLPCPSQALDNHYLGAARGEARARAELQAAVERLQTETISLRGELASESAARASADRAHLEARAANAACEEHIADLEVQNAALQKASDALLRDRDGLVDTLQHIRDAYDALHRSHLQLRDRLEAMSRRAMASDEAARAAADQTARAEATAAALRRALTREASHGLSVSRAAAPRLP
jgi:chromosome segregation ATPase